MEKVLTSQTKAMRPPDSQNDSRKGRMAPPPTSMSCEGSGPSSPDPEPMACLKIAVSSALSNTRKDAPTSFANAAATAYAVRGEP